MHKLVISGNKLYLRNLKRSDLKGDYFNWLNDEEVTRFLESGGSPNTVEKMEEYYRRVTLNPDNVMLAIIDKKSDKHIGNIKLGPINKTTRTAALGIMIGNKDFWGKGYGTVAIKLMVKYAFQQLNLHEVTAGIVAIHQASINAFQKAGFEITGKIKNQFHLDGGCYDYLQLSITRDNYLGTPGTN